MASNVITLNIYEVNGASVPTKSELFPTQGLNAYPYNGASTTGQLYGTIVDRSTGYTYATAETVAQLKTLLNA